MTSAIAPRLSDAELGQMLELVRAADSVELKATVPESTQRSAIAALGMDPLGAQIRQVFFFDTPDLALNHAGVVVRARRVQGKPSDTVVKLRPVVPGQLPKALRRSPDFGVEVDAMPGGFVCSGTLKRILAGDPVMEVVAGDRPLRKLFSKEQRAFYAEHAPEGIAIDDLTTLGPIFVLKLKFSPGSYGRRLVAELWLYPDDSRLLELSTKCAPADTLDVVVATRSFLAERGIDLTGHQETKTRRALEFFSAKLAADPAEPAESA